MNTKEKNVPSGQLTKQQKIKVDDWFNKKGRDHLCPICGEKNWITGDHFLTSNVFHEGTVRIDGVAHPQVFIVCGNCAFTRQFMAVPMGLFS